jgi:imidazolonepropionase-like amidohydrolase
MKKIFSNITALLLLTGFVQAQETVYPAKENKGSFVITGGTVHIGNGQVLENATIEVTNGKITKVGPAGSSAKADATYDAKGKHVYPGLILLQPILV